MQHRPLGSTGIKVSEIGLGSWQLANPVWGLHDAGEALQVVREALDAGCDFFDTAPGYAGGRSEELLGQALHPMRHRVTICSKFGHTADGATNFDPSALRPALDASLKRLKTDYLDLFLLHNPPVELMDGNRTSLYDELECLKNEGKIRAYGVSLDSRCDLEKVVATTGSGVVEVLFNLFHQEPLAGFREAKARGVGIIVKVPLDSGWLTGKYRSDSRFTGVRDRWSPEIIARRAALVEEFASLVPPGVTMAHAALRYILTQPEVSTVIPGAKTVGQVRDNFAAGEKGLPADVVCALHAFWKRELETNPLPW